MTFTLAVVSAGAVAVAARGWWIARGERRRRARWRALSQERKEQTASEGGAVAPGLLPGSLAPSRRFGGGPSGGRRAWGSQGFPLQ